jgi:hypothetical protein
MDSDKHELAAMLVKQDPSVINQFKEVLMNILISYFKNNIVLLNNLVEISEKIIMKKKDLELLISILIERPREKIQVDIAEDIDVSK